MSASAAVKQEQKPVHLTEEATSGEAIGYGQYVTFSSNGRSYGVDIMLVREIRSWSPMTELPEQPTGACGVLDIRGEVVQVFDLSMLLGSGATQVTEGHVVLVLAIAGQTIGILVDAVSDIIEIRTEELRPAPPNRTGGPGVVSGIAKYEDNIVAVLDLAPILGSQSF